MAIDDNSPQMCASCQLPTIYGEFRFEVYLGQNQKEHILLVKGDVDGAKNVLCRVHSECITSEVFSSTKCDCKQQLEAAMLAIQNAPLGIVIYLRQEGRGIGLGNKIRAYAEQERGLDTVDANTVLGLPNDARDYDDAVKILKKLGVKSIDLLTNNPQKIEALKKGGIAVRRIGHHVSVSSAHAKNYVEVKKRRMGHLDENDDS